MVGYKTNIEKETLRNKFYRKVLFTGKHAQLVVMSLKPKDDIPMEVHPHIDQFIRIEKGTAYVKIGSSSYNLKDGDAVVIPYGNKHYVKNTSATKPLKLYTIYSPAEHKPGTIHKTRKDAINAKH